MDIASIIKALQVANPHMNCDLSHAFQEAICTKLEVLAYENEAELIGLLTDSGLPDWAKIILLEVTDIEPSEFAAAFVKMGEALTARARRIEHWAEPRGIVTRQGGDFGSVSGLGRE